MPEDVIVDSSSTEGSADSSQATSQPVNQQQNTEEQVPFHKHPRWQQLQGELRSGRQTIQQLQQMVGELQRGQMQARSGPGLNDEQRRQYGEAAAALKQVLQHDPELAPILQMLKQYPQFAQQLQQFSGGQQELQQAAAKANLQNARAVISDLVSQHNLAFGKEDMPMVNALIARAAMSLENGDERYRQGDETLFEEAFKSVLPFLKKFGAAATVQTAATKGKTTNLPPANTRGGLPGSTALPKLERGKERDYESELGKLARRMLGAGGSEAA